MMMPLIILALGALVAGFIPFGNYVSSDGLPLESTMDIKFSIAPVLLALSGILMAIWLYKKQNNISAKVAANFGMGYKLVYQKFYVDELYLFITKNILFNLIGRPAAWIDKNIVDGMINVSGITTLIIAEKIKRFQSGKVQQYSMFFLAGIIGLAVIFIYVWK